MSEVKPYNTHKSKKKEVEEMFDSISGKYDFLNRLLSLKIDVIWRNKLVSILKENKPQNVLDVATGTGDLAISIAKKTEALVTGYDLSQKMLDVGILKIKKQNLESRIKMIKGDAENIPLNNDSYDAVTVAFGVRNFENLEEGLKELSRVLKPSGVLLILEFSKAEGFLAPIFQFYFKNILPKIGQIISKDSRAYTYLPDSVEAFPSGENLKKIILKQNFSEVSYKKLTFGIATIYKAIK